MREIERPAGLETRDTADLFAAANPSGGGEVCATARRPDFGSIGFRRGIGLRNASHYERQRQSLYPGPFTRSG